MFLDFNFEKLKEQSLPLRAVIIMRVSKTDVHLSTLKTCLKGDPYVTSLRGFISDVIYWVTNDVTLKSSFSIYSKAVFFNLSFFKPGITLSKIDVKFINWSFLGHSCVALRLKITDLILKTSGITRKYIFISCFGLNFISNCNNETRLVKLAIYNTIEKILIFLENVFFTVLVMFSFSVSYMFPFQMDTTHHNNITSFSRMELNNFGWEILLLLS